jgi:hypothetical protein
MGTVLDRHAAQRCGEAGASGGDGVAGQVEGVTLPPSYAAFLASKAPRARMTGIEPGPMPAHLFDFQAEVARFMLRAGRAAGFLDTGLGKGRTALECLRQAGEATNGTTLHMVPLAVARQIEAEGRSLGYDIRVIRSQDDARPGINVCNYDRLDGLDLSAYGAISLDESHILASLTGATARHLIENAQGVRFRFCWSATPAPNDHAELGAHAEFLGIMRSIEMLSRWFINDTATASQEWRLKGHAVDAFWDWVASWARCAQSPEDLGFDGSRFILPPLEILRHKVEAEGARADGTLFGADLSATTMHAKKRQTAEARARIVADLVDAEPHEPWLLWCDSDAEADALMAAVTGAVEVRGSHATERKETTIADFVEGRKRYLIAKPSACGYGLNLQHCARVAFIGRSFSYRAWYQAVRRCWRFGQMRNVNVHLIVAEGEDQIGRVIDRKADGHAEMKRAMSASMVRARETAAETKVPYVPTHKTELPQWLLAA